MKPSMRVRSASELSRELRDREWREGAAVGAALSFLVTSALWLLLDHGTLWIARWFMG